MTGVRIQVEGGASSSWGNLSWVIPDVAVVYPVQVIIGDMPLLVVGVPSLVTFSVAPKGSDVLLQLQPAPTGGEGRSVHVVVEQMQSAGPGQEGVMSIICTSWALDPPPFPLLFVSISTGGGVGASQKVLSRASLNVTCVASSVTVQPAAASVAVDQAFVVKVSVIQAAPPSFLPLTCDPGMLLRSPPPALMPLSDSGLYEGVFVLKCRLVVCAIDWHATTRQRVPMRVLHSLSSIRNAGVLACAVGSSSIHKFTAHCMCGFA